MTNSLSYIYLIFMLVFVHVPFILIYLFEEKIFSKRSFWKVFPIVFVNFFILFLITTDWGRWINVHIIMLGISIIYLFKETKTKEEFAEKNHKKSLNWCFAAISFIGINVCMEPKALLQRKFLSYGV